MQILCKKTQNITAQGIHDTFCRGRKSYDCVATFSSPHRPAHLPPHPNWIADGVAMKRVTASNYVQYLSPKGLQTFLNMARTPEPLAPPVRAVIGASRPLRPQMLRSGP